MSPVIGAENSHHFINPSDSKLNPIAPWLLAFSRASGSFFNLSSHWLLLVCPLILIGRFDYFGLCFTTLNWKVLYSLEKRFFQSLKSYSSLISPSTQSIPLSRLWRPQNTHSSPHCFLKITSKLKEFLEELLGEEENIKGIFKRGREKLGRCWCQRKFDQVKQGNRNNSNSLISSRHSSCVLCSRPCFF